MKKLRLDLDAIRVERFETLAPERSRGSVLGFFTLVDNSCNPGNTCHLEQSCGYTSPYERCRCG
jgi:hypothetical protein